MNKKLLAIMACLCMLLVCVGALIACNEECEHNFVDGVCTKCNEPDPDYVQPKIDYDMSGVKFHCFLLRYNISFSFCFFIFKNFLNQIIYH